MNSTLLRIPTARIAERALGDSSSEAENGALMINRCNHRTMEKPHFSAITSMVATTNILILSLFFGCNRLHKDQMIHFHTDDAGISGDYR
jgi:hypothetical protein